MIVGDPRLFEVRSPTKYIDGKPSTFSLMGLNGRGFLERPYNEIFVPTEEQATNARKTMAPSIAANEIIEKGWKKPSALKKSALHRAFLIESGIVPSGSNIEYGRESCHSTIRKTSCWKCATPITNFDLWECTLCGWIICSCGACGCSSAAKQSTPVRTEIPQMFDSFESARDAIQGVTGATLRKFAEGKWVVVRNSVSKE